MKIEEAERIAYRYYEREDYEHAKAVAKYTIDSPLVKQQLFEADFYIVALMHDILEDTDIPEEEFEKFSDIQKTAIKLLTKPKSMKYTDYLKKIRKEAEEGYLEAYIAYIVKLADMKDHLSRKETLTDRLKEKYIEGMAVLL